MAGMLHAVAAASLPCLPSPLQMQATAKSSPCANPVRVGSFAAWAVALRPPSLLVAVSPVLVGASLAWQRTGHVDVLLVIRILVAAILIQVITNLQNDVGYTVRRAERGNRVGMPRATANGWLSVAQVRAAIVAVIAVTLLLGLPLVQARGMPVLLMGVGSIAAALAYMGGPRPIAYTPAGELTVFVFFGLVAVGGTEFVLTGSTTTATWFAAGGIGALASAALALNNHRDIAHDAEVGRRTFGVCFGTAASRRLYGGALLSPFALTLALAGAIGSRALLLPLVLLPAAWRLRRDVIACPEGSAFTALLVRTFKLELMYAVLVSLALIAARA
jgi:1,4-dihydroxy-2-naphthoate octaprenyltransferase